MKDSELLELLAKMFEETGPHNWSCKHINQILFGLGGFCGNARALSKLPNLTAEQRLLMNRICKSMVIPEDRFPEPRDGEVKTLGLEIDGEIIDLKNPKLAEVVDIFNDSE